MREKLRKAAALALAYFRTGARVCNAGASCWSAACQEGRRFDGPTAGAIAYISTAAKSISSTDRHNYRSCEH